MEGRGSYRNVFTVQGLPIAIKIPQDFYTDNMKDSIQHSRVEITEFRRLNRLKSAKRLLKYLPKLYYSDYQNGIIILQKIDRRLRSSGTKQKAVEEIKRFYGYEEDNHNHDWWGHNLGKIGKRTVIFDLGVI